MFAICASIPVKRFKQVIYIDIKENSQTNIFIWYSIEQAQKQYNANAEMYSALS